MASFFCATHAFFLLRHFATGDLAQPQAQSVKERSVRVVDWPRSDYFMSCTVTLLELAATQVALRVHVFIR